MYYREAGGPDMPEMLTRPALMSQRTYFKYYPGVEYQAVPETRLLTGEPVILRLGYDCGPGQVRDARATAEALRGVGYDVSVFLPFYAARFLPGNLKRHVAEGPSLPRDNVRTLGLKPPLAALLADANGRAYPALVQDVATRVQWGEEPVQAIVAAYQTWAPQILDGLDSYATSARELADFQLVRVWERTPPRYTCPYYKTGREALEFFHRWGAVRREGRGRVVWAPLWRTVYGYYLTTKKLDSKLVP